ncbi:MAG: type 4a pilus biogenesis protein PilO [Fimbriimonas sp.]
MKATRDPRVFMLLGGLGVALGAGLLYAQYGGLTEQQAKVDSLAAQVRAQKDVPAQLQVSQRELDRVRSELAHLERNVPDFAYVPTLLRELEAVGKASGLRVLGIRPLPKSDAAKAEDAKGLRKAYEEIEIDVTCQGTYGGILKFVNALNAFPKIMAARAVSVEPKPDPLQPKLAPKLEINARLRAYLFSEPQAARTTDKTAMAPGGNYAAG